MLLVGVFFLEGRGVSARLPHGFLSWRRGRVQCVCLQLDWCHISADVVNRSRTGLVNRTVASVELLQTRAREGYFLRRLVPYHVCDMIILATSALS